MKQQSHARTYYGKKLIGLSENGNKTDFSEAEAQLLLDLIEIYAKTSMPFSPIDHPLSSRKRLIDDLSLRIIEWEALR